MKHIETIRRFQLKGLSLIVCAAIAGWAGNVMAQTNETKPAQVADAKTKKDAKKADKAPQADKADKATNDAKQPIEAAAGEAKPAQQPKPVAEVDYVALPEPMAFAKDRYAEALRLNAMAPSKERDDKLRVYVADLIDYDDYAIRCMGDKWPTIAPDKQVAFQKKFRELLELTYLKRFSDKSFKDDYKVDWDRVVKKKDSAIVSCFTQQKDVETEFELILHAVDNRWQIYDTLVDGASLAQTYQKKYAKKIDERGIDAILSDMQKEIDKLKKM